MMFDRGWAVMISDVGNDAQESPHGVFTGKYAANTLLYGVRSAMRLEDAGLGPQAPVGIFGIAGGGVGAGFAAERAASYAPELNIRGSALEGMVVDQRNFFRGSDGSLGSGFVFATLLGPEPKYPEMDLNSHCARCSPRGSRRRTSPSSSTSTMTTCSAPRVHPRRRPC